MIGLGFIGNLVKTILAPLTPILGTFLKGKLTGAGVVTTITGLATGFIAPHIVTDQNLVPLLHEIGYIITALGGFVASFGHGRHVGDTTASTPTISIN